MTTPTTCRICGDPDDHHGACHSDVTGDRRGRYGLQRADGTWPHRDDVDADPTCERKGCQAPLSQHELGGVFCP